MAKIGFISYTPNQTVLFPQRIDEDIAENSPVRIVSAVVDSLDLSKIRKLYKPCGRNAYHPRMMLKVIIYAYMNNIYSCRRIEELLLRDMHFIWLSGRQKPDYITINRFRNRVKDEINNVFTQLVLILADKGFLSLDVEYVDGTKIESKANRYTFVWRKNVERNRSRLVEQIKALLKQVDEAIAQENTAREEPVEFTPAVVSDIIGELQAVLDREPEPSGKEEGKAHRVRHKQIKKRIKELEKKQEKLAGYDQQLGILGNRNSYSKTDLDATFMHMKDDVLNNGQTKPAYNLQIGTENQFITNFALYPNPGDTFTLIPFLSTFAGRYGRMPGEVVADAGYGSEENYRFMEESGSEAFVKYNHFDREQRSRHTPDPAAAENLYYNEKDDYYVCMMGQHMVRTAERSVKTESGYTAQRVQYTAQCCEGCPLRCVCFQGKGNRTIEVSRRLQEYRRRARERLTSEQGVRHRKKRSIEPEAVFGQIKYDMAYKRFRHFFHDKVTMDFAFFAIAFNIKKMCAKIAKGVLRGIFDLILAFHRLYRDPQGRMQDAEDDFFRKIAA